MSMMKAAHTSASPASLTDPPPTQPSLAVCKPVPGYSAAPDVDRSGDDIANYGGLAAAAAKCDADPNCLAINTNGWAKRTAFPLVAARGSCLYTKIPTGQQRLTTGRRRLERRMDLLWVWQLTKVQSPKQSLIRTNYI